MSSRRTSAPVRQRIGSVSVYFHHGQYYVYQRQNGAQLRRPVSANLFEAEAVASLLNAAAAAEAGKVSLTTLQEQWLGIRTPVSQETACSVTVAAIRDAFLRHHELVLNSRPATVKRYRTATLYLLNYHSGRVDQLDASGFVGHLRGLRVSPNGHKNTDKRPLRDRGIRYILETARSLVHFAHREKLLPTTIANPFASLQLSRLTVRDRKPVFVFGADQESAFFTRCPPDWFAVHVLLAKTGMRVGELVHLLVEDLDLNTGWANVRSKPELGWITKTNRERRVPLADEVVELLRFLIGSRNSGIAVVRRTVEPVSLREIHRVAERELAQLHRQLNRPPAPLERDRALQRIWYAAGAVDPDRVRTSFIRTARAADLPAIATCPKSWRHTFATLLQEANVDPLIRQETLGHKPLAADQGALGMTGVYTHTTPARQRAEIDRALRLRPETLARTRMFATTPEDPAGAKE